MEQLATGFLWYFAFVFSTVLHEAAHAWAALKMGDRTAYEGGQVTIDPVPHMRREPVGMILVPLFTYFTGGWMMGWASAPYSVDWARRYPKRAAWMALAGPMANLSLVLLSAVVIRVGLATDLFYSPSSIDYDTVVLPSNDGLAAVLASFVNVFFSLNVGLFFFNLVPLPPLDGSSVIALFMSEERAATYQEVMRNPSFSFFGLFVAWKIFGALYSPLHLACINLLYAAITHYS